MSATATHAMNSYIAIEDPDNPGTYVDVSTKAYNVSMPFTKGDVDTSTFGQGDNTAVSGMRDATFSLSVYGDAALNTLLFAIFMAEGPVSVRYGPVGNASGAQRFTADFNMTGWTPGGSVTSANAGDVTFHRTGATTLDTF